MDITTILILIVILPLCFLVGYWIGRGIVKLVAAIISSIF